MKKFETNKMKMYMLIQLGMRENEALWQGIPYIADSIAQLNANIETIGLAAGEQDLSAKGYTEKKKKERDKLEGLMLFIAMQIKSYAQLNTNENLQNQIRNTKSSLYRSRDKDLVFDADILHAIATENLATITNFGVTASILTDLQTAKVRFVDALTAPIQRRQLQKEATQTIMRTIKETDDLLKNHLDRQMLVFKNTEEQFYTLYTMGRKIIGSPTIKTAMRIKVIDAVTQAPLPKALIVIKDHNIKRLSSPLGQIVIRNLKEGNHIISVTLAGYLPESPTVTHVKGETTVVVVEMGRKFGGD